LSANFFRELNLQEPDYNLGIGSQLPNKQISDCIWRLNDVLQIENPDIVLVIGDTNTTAAAAIATKKRNILLGHIEAGLREFDRRIPEEINKLITDAISDLYFVPTKTGVENLRRQGITDRVYLTGDIGLDLLTNDIRYKNPDQFRESFQLSDKYVFMTCHREVNTSNCENLKSILEGVSDLSYQVIFPVHPRTAKAIVGFDLERFVGDNVRMIGPLGFWDTQQLIRGAYAVVTDSGGIIKEAYFHGVPTIIIDRQTEWMEAVEEGWSTLAGPSKESIVRTVEDLHKPESNHKALGDGLAGKRIVKILEEFLDVKKS
jgi:UDP-GlcNAc3NAcA epimerase